MTESQRIANQLARSFDGTAWVGPNLTSILSGVSTQAAVSRPIANAHTILEIVLHMTAWNRVVRQRLAGRYVGSLLPERDFPAVKDSDPNSWTRAVAELERQVVLLKDAIESTDDARLEELTPEATYTVYEMLHGVIQHNLYHGGQIVLLAKEGES